MSSGVHKSITLTNPEIVRILLGAGDCHLRRVRDRLQLKVVLRRDLLLLNGSSHSVDCGIRTFQSMIAKVEQGSSLNVRDVDQILDHILSEEEMRESPDWGFLEMHPETELPIDDALGNRQPKPRLEQFGPSRVRAMTDGQRAYIDSIRSSEVVFATGPAGSGKTYLAVAMAIEALSRRIVNRLILVRPAVEAGEHLGFLPGDLREKVNPYLRPLYDALNDMLMPEQVARLTEKGVIEIAPLAFMRGRTLNSAFVILDEAQNTTAKQMKMFLTRLGRSSRTVVTGDVTQVDLPDGSPSGLAHAREVLKYVEGVSFITLQKADIVRHPLVQRIVDAYDAAEAQHPHARSSSRKLDEKLEK